MRCPKITGCASVCALLLAALPATSLPASGGDAFPQLEVRPSGAHGVWLEMAGARDGDDWILQDSYDGMHWRDLHAFKGVPIHETFAFRPTRFFRGMRKALDAPQTALNRARQQWQSLRLTEYQYNFSTSGSIGLTEQMVAVKDSVVFDDFVIESPAPWGPGPGETIETLFDRIQSAIDRHAARILVLYHPALGFPESILVDYNRLIADDEWSWRLTAAPRQLPELLTEGEQRWLRNTARNYRYHLVFASARRHWEGDIEVIDGSAMAIGPPPAFDHIVRTMDEHFEFLRAAHSGDSEVAAWFDPKYGFPAFLSKDWRWTFFDGPGEHYTITGFQWIE